MRSENKCSECQSGDLVKLTTYKRHWLLCRTCGCGTPRQKSYYPLSFLPCSSFKKSASDEASMYDYFVAPVHIEYSLGTAHEFIKDYLKPWNIEVSGKKILDVSGGNGHFLNVFKEMGADVTMTEINEPSIDYARTTHGMKVFCFNFNEHRIDQLTDEKYDIIMLRAAIMFCKDLPQHVQDLKKILKPGGQIIVNHSVIPTLGVAVRVQLDEFSYFSLRQADRVVQIFEKEGFKLEQRRDETDPSLYVYDHDLKLSWRIIHYLYEWYGLRALRKDRIFSFPARDRRRSTMMFRAA